MTIRRQTIRSFVSAGIFMAFVVSLQADYYVATNGLHTNSYTSWENAATNYSNTNTPAQVVLNGQGTNRGLNATFSVSGQTLELNGFTVSNCYSTSNGGGLTISTYATSASATLKNCIFVENRVQTNVYGGAVSCMGSTGYEYDLLVSNCVFLTNSAQGGGAGQILRTKSTTMVDCTAIGNFATGDSSGKTVGAGAFYFTGNNALNLRGCTFLSNRCENARGGGALLHSSAFSCVLTDCLFEENEAIRGTGGESVAGHGGAVYNYDSNLFATNCIFRNNRANSSFSYGGAIYAFPESPQTYLYNCLVVGNRSNGEPLGPVYSG